MHSIDNVPMILIPSAFPSTALSRTMRLPLIHGPTCSNNVTHKHLVGRTDGAASGTNHHDDLRVWLIALVYQTAPLSMYRSENSSIICSASSLWVHTWLRQCAFQYVVILPLIFTSVYRLSVRSHWIPLILATFGAATLVKASRWFPLRALSAERSAPTLAITA